MRDPSKHPMAQSQHTEATHLLPLGMHIHHATTPVDLCLMPAPSFFFCGFEGLAFSSPKTGSPTNTCVLSTSPQLITRLSLPRWHTPFCSATPQGRRAAAASSSCLSVFCGGGAREWRAPFALRAAALIASARSGGAAAGAPPSPAPFIIAIGSAILGFDVQPPSTHRNAARPKNSACAPHYPMLSLLPLPPAAPTHLSCQVIHRGRALPLPSSHRPPRSACGLAAVFV